MEQTVYADLLFAINFSMDFLCLYLVARLTARKLSLLRLALAAALGGIYSVISLVIWLPEEISLAVDLALCLILCLAAFARRGESLSSLLLAAAAFFLASLLLGGIMTAVFHLLNRFPSSATDWEEGGDMPLWLFALVALLSSLVTLIGGRFLKTRAGETGADVDIFLGDRHVALHAMCDSGNLLHDSVSGRPVMLLDLCYAKALLPKSCPPPLAWSAELLPLLSSEIATRIRVIPVTTATGESILYALRPDQVILHIGRRTRTAEVLIGFSDLRSTLPHGGTAILSPELLT